MASPQVENGHIDIANELAEALARIRLSGEESQILWVIIRKTYGWHKKEDRIALSQFVEFTGINKQSCHRALGKLSSKKVIAVIKKGYENINSYCINKDFDKWKPVDKKAYTVIKKAKRVSSKKVTTKTTITKENIYPEDFLVFYNSYPRKKKKDDALKAWKQRNGDRPELSIILSSINRQKSTPGWKKDGGQYIPYPASWLRSGSWEDEIENTEITEEDPIEQEYLKKYGRSPGQHP